MTRVRLARESLQAVLWNGAGTMLGITLQFVVGVLLARLLGPEPFGLVAIAWLVLGLGNLLASVGLGAALVQRKELHEDDIRAVFFLQFAVGGSLSVLVAAGAPYVASFFQKPQAAPLVEAMALVFVIQPLGQTSVFLLRRELRFKQLQIAQIASYCVGYLGLGVPLALNGAGAWSLVAAQLAQASVYSSVVYLQTRHAVLPFAWPRGRGLIGFGATVTASNLANYGLRNLDSVIVGKLFEANQFGLYNRAFALLSLPLNAVMTSVQPVLFSACARAQDQLHILRRAFLAIEGIMALLLPPFAVAAAVPDLVVLGLYGDGWAQAVPILTPLALAMPIYGLSAMVGPLCMALGRPDIELRTQLVPLILFLLLVIFAAAHGLTAVAWAVFAGYLIRMVAFLSVAIRLFDVPLVSLLEMLAPPVYMAVVLAGFAWLLSLALHAPMVLALLVVIAACAVLYLGLLVMLRRRIVRGAMREFLAGLGTLPKPLMNWAGLN